MSHKLDQLKQERLLTAASALLKIQQMCAETIARIHQLDGSIFAYEEIEKSAGTPAQEGKDSQ